MHPKWHKGDRMWIRTAASRVIFEAHFRIRKDGVGISFHLGDWHWHEAVMDGWDDRAAVSCLLTCVFWHVVPRGRHPGVLRVSSDSYIEPKYLQNAIRKSKTGWDKGPWPVAVAEPLLLLQERYGQLSGADVEEAIRRLEGPFRFLTSRGVPFERIRRAWDEAKCAEVMKS